MTKPKIRASHLISIEDLSKAELLHILQCAKKLKKKQQPSLLKGSILANCFFEPSTRTRLSFETSMIRLGGNIIGFSDPQSTSLQKKESLSDSIKIISQYADILVIRHPQEGSARLAAENSTIPVINAGDGANQHPTQTLTDLFSILETQKSLEGLHVALVGDLKHGRTVHSLVMALAHFNARIYCISPPHLTMPEHICQKLRQHSVRFSFHNSIEEIIGRTDILYMTRMQKERFDPIDALRDAYLYVVLPEFLKKAKKNLKILHPLPRNEEIPREIDLSSHAYYFEQAKNGIYVRQALLALLLHKSI